MILDNFVDLVLNNNQSTFIYGCANTSKTSLAKKIATKLNENNIKCAFISASGQLSKQNRSDFIKNYSFVNKKIKNLSVNFSTMSALAYEIVNHNNQIQNHENSSNNSQNHNGLSDDIMITANEQIKILNESLIEFCEYEKDLSEQTVKLYSSDPFLAELRVFLDIVTRYDVSLDGIYNYSEFKQSYHWGNSRKIVDIYLKKLKQMNKYDYNTIIFEAQKILWDNSFTDNSDENTSKKYEYIIVDDANELNYANCKLLETFSSSGVKIILLGNKYLTINSFKGAVGDWSKCFTVNEFQTITLDDHPDYILQTPLENNQSIPNSNLIIQTHELSNFNAEIKFVISQIRKKYLQFDANYSDFAIVARSESKIHDAICVFDQFDIPVSYNFAQTPIKNSRIWNDLVDILCQVDDFNELPLENAIWQAWQQLEIEDVLVNSSIIDNSTYANDALDTVIYIIELAKKLVAENGVRFTIEKFIDYIESQSIGIDNIYKKNEVDAVRLHTPMSIIGNRYKYVFIIELQDNVWPNLNSRLSIMKPYLLQDIVEGKIHNESEYNFSTEYNELRVSELKLLQNAINRANNEVHIVCQSNDEIIPSTFIDLNNINIVEETPILTFSDYISQSRYTLIEDLFESHKIAIKSGNNNANLAENNTTNNNTVKFAIENNVVKQHYKKFSTKYNELALLHNESINEFNPSNWYFNFSPTETISILDSEDVISFSPSSMESFLKCPLLWFYERNGGKGEFSASAQVGTLIHKIAEDIPELIDNNLELTFEQMQNLCKQLLNTSEFEKLNDEIKNYSFVQKMRNDKNIENLLKALIKNYSENADISEVAPNPDGSGKNMLELKLQSDIGSIKYKDREIKVKINGSIDRVEKFKDSNNYCVVDWKTGKKKWTRFEKTSTLEIFTQNPQILLYRIMLQDYLDNIEKNKMNVSSGKLVYLGNKTKNNTLFYDGEIENAKIKSDLLEIIKNTLVSDTFCAKINDACSYCALKNSCEAQIVGSRFGESGGKNVE